MTRDPRIAFFDAHAPRWHTYGPPVEQVLARLESLRPVLGLAPGDDVLEVGCGTGGVTAWLAAAVRPGRVTAVDFSPRMLDLARARGADADLRLADVCSDDVGNRCYDVAWCMHVFPHFRDRAAALRNMARALRPAGRLIVLHIVGRQRVNAVHAGAGGPVAGDHLPPPDLWPDMLGQAGLQLIDIADRSDLFLVVARRPGSGAPPPGNSPSHTM